MLKGTGYTITTQNIMGHELIGLPVVISHSTDHNKKGIQGRVIDETQNTLTVETNNGEKKIPKKEVKIMVELGKEKVMVEGMQIVAKPEDRVKLYWRKFHG